MKFQPRGSCPLWPLGFRTFSRCLRVQVLGFRVYVWPQLLEGLRLRVYFWA